MFAVEAAEGAFRDPATADPTPAELTQIAIAHALIAIADTP